MGAVYEARDTRLPRSVAIKVLKEELHRDADAVRRFKREARLASLLNHPNICTILEVGGDEAQSFIAMELLEGASLKARMLGAPFTVDEIVDISSQVSDGLAAAHEEGIIHRDITPANIFLTSGGLVKLLDFGLAKHFPDLSSDDEQTTDELTKFGATVGTIYYMSPEQLAGAAVDSRCDFFALGAVMYQMATGARPFDNMTRPALSDAIRHQPHLPCGNWRRTIPPSSRGSSTRCSQNDPTIGISRRQPCGSRSTGCSGVCRQQVEPLHRDGSEISGRAAVRGPGARG